MKWALFTAMILFAANAYGGEPLTGHWFYYKKIHQGYEMPEPPEATLRLHYEFFENGTSRLYWWHEGENDRCERRGRYSVADGVLTEEATWVDPANHPSCARDPDMHEGKVTRTPYDLSGGDLFLHLPFGSEILTYVWKYIPSAGQNPGADQ